MNSRTHNIQKSIRYFISFVAIFITSWGLWGSTSPDSFLGNEWLRDQYVQLQASNELESRFIIVDIDESSLASEGPWPWPRSRIADMIETLVHDYGAKGVALDMVVPEPSDIQGDVRLAKLAQSEPLVLAQALDYVKRTSPLRIGYLAGGQPVVDSNADLPIAYGYIANHALLKDSPCTGNIGFVPDSDGVIRRLPFITYFDGRNYPTLSLALLQCIAGNSITTSSQPNKWQRIPFARNLSSYTVATATDVLNLRVPLSTIAGKMVLVGSSSLGLADSVATPLTPNTSGVLVHAAMLTSQLDQASGKAPDSWPGSLLAFIFTVSVIVLSTYTLSRLSALANASLLLAFSILWILLAYLIAPHDGSFSTTIPLASFLFLLAVSIPYHWQLSQHKSRDLLDTLNHYVAPAVVKEIFDSGLKNPLSPRQVYITTLIADMEGYTKHVEGLQLDDAATLTREFLDCLTIPVLECRGTLDKYTGDGLVAFWGAPIHDENHADLALDAAQRMLIAVSTLNKSRGLLGSSSVRVRIGVESGIAMAGDFGSSSRSIFTAVGDSVNTASRLEEVARDFPHDIIIGPGTAAIVKRHRLLPLGDFQLRGKQKPTSLFTLN